MIKETTILYMAVVLPSGCSTKTEKKKDHSDEVKIARTVDLSKDDRADSVKRKGDQRESPHFKHPGFYHTKSTGTLTLLPKFRTMQRTSEWSCGVNAALMVLRYCGKLGKHNEGTLTQLCTNKLKNEATSLQSMIQILKGVGRFQIHSAYDYRGDDYDKISLHMIQGFLKKDIPVMVAQNDWKGRWQMIIGYDTMGTETTQDNILIVADSYDITDRNQGGYDTYPIKRFHYNQTMYNFFSKSYGIAERDKLLIAVEPKT